MDHLHWYDVLRALTASISLVCMYLSARRFRRLGHSFDKRMLDLWWVMNGFLFVTFEGSLEQMLGLHTYGPRVVLVFIVVVVCLRSNFRRGGYFKPGSNSE